MAASVPHRGPRVESVEVGRCALAMTTADDERADSVIGIRDGIGVVMTGSLDNAAELARALRPPGADRPGPDPSDLVAVLAGAYRAYGSDTPTHLRGVFAVVITDGERVVAFRDHVGYRPLFFREHGSTILVASEVKQILAGAGLAREPDMDVVASIFFRTVDDDTPAALRGARRLPKATTLTVTPDAGVALRRYWHPGAILEARPVSPAELQERFDALLGQAVTRCLTGHDAISLSGGVDSPAVAAYAAPRHRERFKRPLHAISVTYPRHPSVDERAYVELVAERLDIPLHLYVQEANPIADMERWTRLTDTPYRGAALAQYEEDYLRARALGIRTMLTGEHAEFVFAMQWYTLDHFLTHRRYRAAWNQLQERRARGMSVFGLARLAARSVASDRILMLRNRIGGPRQAPHVPTWVDPTRAAGAEFLPARARWKDSQLAGFTGPGISLEAEEICQAVSGVISRKPWTDVDLWEFFLGLPAEQKFPDLRAKGLVRRLLRGRVPDEILDRTDKTVFDEAAIAQIDYAELARLIGLSERRIAGVDYDMLHGIIDRRAFTPVDYQWARNLANVHAFLAQW